MLFVVVGFGIVIVLASALIVYWNVTLDLIPHQKQDKDRKNQDVQ